MRAAAVTSTVRIVGRLGARDLRVADAATAICLGVILVATEIAQGQASLTSTLAGVVVSSTVAFRRYAPASMALLAGAGASVAGDSSPAQLVGSVAVGLDYYLVGRKSAERGWSWIDAALLALPLPAIVLAPGTPGPGSPLVVDVVSVWAFLVVIPFAAGRVVGGHIALTAALRVNTERLAEEQRERVRQVTAQERARIARELHDVVAHGVSVMVIQAVAARAVAGRDRGAAAGALRSVERCGREALVDLRQMIGVLHRDDSEVLGAASPGLAQLERLAERARTAGLAVDVRMEGESRPLSAALGLGSYRVVQEALTNAIKHAGPARAQVRVIFDRDCLKLEIADTGRGSAHGDTSAAQAGHGLMGMRERLALYGGQLHAGNGTGGGFAVHATIPLPVGERP
jgi:signal transduction histidine kinase